MGCVQSSGAATNVDPKKLPNAADAKEQELRELRQLSPEQQAAADKAAESATERARQLEEGIDRHVADGELWDKSGGAAIEALLQHTPLVDIQYIIELIESGGVLPRHQEVPLPALITSQKVWMLRQWAYTNDYTDGLPVLVLSYPWLDWFHPDRLGTQMRRLLPIFRAFLALAKYHSPDCTVGVMIDFVCLPQQPYASTDEASAFKKSLSKINQWYGHRSTYVLLVTTPPPEGADYSNCTLHTGRGWCFFEKTMSSLVKQGECLLDFGNYRESAAPAPNPRIVTKRPPETPTARFQKLRGLLVSHRPSMFSPDIFASEMRSRVETGALKFTAKADMETVIEQYRIGFVESFSTVLFNDKDCIDSQSMCHLNWGDEEGFALLESLKYADKHCHQRGRNLEIDIRYGSNFSTELLTKFEEFNSQSSKFKIMYWSSAHPRILLCG